METRKFIVAHIWYWDEKYWIRVYSQVEDGMSNKVDNPIHIIPESAIRRLPKLLLQSFEEFESGVKRLCKPEEYKDWALKLTGIKSQRAFDKKARVLWCRLHEDGKIEIDPLHYKRGELMGTFDRPGKVCSQDEDELLVTIKEVFKMCEPDWKPEKK